MCFDSCPQLGPRKKHLFQIDPLPLPWTLNFLSARLRPRRLLRGGAPGAVGGRPRAGRRPPRGRTGDIWVALPV